MGAHAGEGASSGAKSGGSGGAIGGADSRGRTLGILGGGQLARMLMLAAHPLGIRVRALDPDPDAPAGHVGEHVVGAYDDEASLARFAQGLDAVTYEFENVPTRALEFVASRGLGVRPAAGALATGQDRWNEKRLFVELGIGVPRCEAAGSAEEAARAVERVGVPCVMKTRRLGYDGKGQRVLRGSGDGIGADAREAFAALGSVPVVVEAFVAFEREVSIVAVRGIDGAFDAWPLTENVHREGILRRSVAPAEGGRAGLEDAARRAARAIMERLDYVGVLAVEFFVVRGAGGEEMLLANEMAPRVHNSGHWTIEGAGTSQFENHVRACVGLPLGPTGMRAGVGWAGMVNLIGGWPEVSRMLGVEGAYVHLYGKSPREGRKVGHVTVTGATAAEVRGRMEAVEALL